MDTIELICRDHLTSEMLRCAIWRHISPVVARVRFGKVHHTSGRKMAQYGIYAKHFAGIFEDQFVVVGWNPRHGKNRHAEASVAFHLSHFENLSAAFQWLLRLTDFDAEILKALQVRRLDACVDLGVPFDTVRQVLDVKHLQSSTLYSGRHGRTAYYGRDKLHQVYVYERPTLTRIEVRLESRMRRDARPVETLGDLLLAPRFYPFEHLRIVDVQSVQLLKLTNRQSVAVESFQYLVATKGFCEAKRQVSRRSGNYKRDIEPFLCPSSKIDLPAEWWRAWHSFFEVPSNGGHQ